MFLLFFYQTKSVLLQPLAGEWVGTENDLKIYKTFLESFLGLNADLAAELECQKEYNFQYENLFQLARSGLVSDNLDHCRRICEFLMEELSVVTKYPVIYAIDEHHEIWKYKKQHHAFIRRFTQSTGACEGVRLFLSKYM
jgi:hypothetical protein